MAPDITGSTFLIAESIINQPKSKDNFNNPSIEKCSLKLVKNEKGFSGIKPDAIIKNGKEGDYQSEIVWRNIIAFIILHLLALYGVWIAIMEKAYTEYILERIGEIFFGFGITAGAHRLWAHRSYKAKLPLRIILMIFQTASFQNSIYEWVRDHRVHHKYTDTNADPHNAKRGFFFSHMGWLLCKKHPDVKAKGKCIDMTDLEADPVVMFQKKHYMILMPLCCFILPTLIPYVFFGSSFRRSFFICAVLRYVVSLHCTWLVNSAAHLYGMRPYDKTIGPVENKMVSMLAFGEGWHNYHHVFPWDYKTAELGSYQFNITKGFIDLFARIGWAYDLKTVSNEMILKRVERTGDGSHEHSYSFKNKTENELIQELNEKCNHENSGTLIWGWNDPEMKDEDKVDAKIINKFKES